MPSRSEFVHAWDVGMSKQSAGPELEVHCMRQDRRSKESSRFPVSSEWWLNFGLVPLSLLRHREILLQGLLGSPIMPYSVNNGVQPR